jgi:hypothetical protein
MKFKNSLKGILLNIKSDAQRLPTVFTTMNTQHTSDTLFWQNWLVIMQDS